MLRAKKLVAVLQCTRLKLYILVNYMHVRISITSNISARESRVQETVHQELRTCDVSDRRNDMLYE